MCVRMCLCVCATVLSSLGKASVGDGIPFLSQQCRLQRVFLLKRTFVFIQFWCRFLLLDSFAFCFCIFPFFFLLFCCFSPPVTVFVLYLSAACATLGTETEECTCVLLLVPQHTS